MNIDAKISKIQKVLYRVLFGECVLKSNVFLKSDKISVGTQLIQSAI